MAVEDGVAGVQDGGPDAEPLPVRARCQDRQVLEPYADRVMPVGRLVKCLEPGQVPPREGKFVVILLWRLC